MEFVCSNSNVDACKQVEREKTTISAAQNDRIKIMFGVGYVHERTDFFTIKQELENHKNSGKIC